MSTEICDQGDTKRLTATFRNLSDVLTDPTTVTLTVRDPDGTEASYTYAGGTISKESTGVFYRDHDFTKAGRHIERWTATGTVKDVAAREWYARRKQQST